MKGAARRALSFIPLFGFAVLVFGQVASVIVIGTAYSVESIGGSIESTAKSREVVVPKNTFHKRIRMPTDDSSHH